MQSINLIKTIRHLASIQIISDIKPHTQSDNLELAYVLGWQVVVKKGEFNIGQKVVYFEIDSMLPPEDWAQPLSDSKFKVETTIENGHLSQGLILPLSIIPSDTQSAQIEIGSDVTKLLNVTKFEEDPELIAISRDTKLFPEDLIDRTEEPRIQSCPEFLERFKGKPYIATIKYDGSSATFTLDRDGELLVCSRNKIQNSDIYSQIAKQLKLHDKLKLFSGRYGIQGEIYGPKISKNYLNVKEKKFAVFNIKDYQEERCLDYNEMKDLCSKMQLDVVEIGLEGDSFDFNMEEIKNISKGVYPGTTNPREGLVFRLKSNWYTKSCRYSFKIINDEFLLIHNKK